MDSVRCERSGMCVCVCVCVCVCGSVWVYIHMCISVRMCHLCPHLILLHLILPLAANPLCDMRATSATLNLLGGAYAADSSQCGLFPLTVVDAILQTLRCVCTSTTNCAAGFHS